MMNKLMFKISIGLIGFVAVVLFLQWMIFSPYEKIKISENGVEKVYLYDENKKTLMLEDNKNEKFGTILRKTENILVLQTEMGKNFYLKDDFDVFNLVSNIKGKHSGTKKVAILYISTGKYIVFWKKFYQAMEKYFLPRHEKTYFLFTDHDFVKVEKNVVKIHQDQLPWPYVTLKRFHFFDKIEKQLKEYDYIYFLNGTMLPIAEVNEEIFPTEEQEIMVTLHPGYWKGTKFSFPYDRNQKSMAYIPMGDGNFYVMGGFNGGTSSGFLTLINTLKEWTDIDLEKNIIASWHDESMLNKYLWTLMNRGKNPLILLPEYAVPENASGYGLNEFFPFVKMLILDKRYHGGHSFLRGQKEYPDIVVKPKSKDVIAIPD